MQLHRRRAKRRGRISASPRPTRDSPPPRGFGNCADRIARARHKTGVRAVIEFALELVKTSNRPRSPLAPRVKKRQADAEFHGNPIGGRGCLAHSEEELASLFARGEAARLVGRLLSLSSSFSHPHSPSLIRAAATSCLALSAFIFPDCISRSFRASQRRPAWISRSVDTDRPVPPLRSPPSPPPSPPPLPPPSDAKRAGNVIYNVYLFADKFNGTSLRRPPPLPTALPGGESALAPPPFRSVSPSSSLSLSFPSCRSFSSQPTRT